MDLMPRAHIPVVTQERALKAEVRSSLVIYQSNPKSPLVHILLVQMYPQVTAYYSQVVSTLCHSEGFLEIKVMIQLLFWITNTDIQNNSM